MFLECWPELADVTFTFAFKHPGVLVGAEAATARWLAPVGEFMARASDIRAGGGGVIENLRVYQALAFSTLRYIGSFDIPSSSARIAEARAVAKVTGAPIWAMHIDLLASLIGAGSWPAIPQLIATAFASQYKACATSEGFGRALSLISDEDGHAALQLPPRRQVVARRRLPPRRRGRQLVRGLSHGVAALLLMLLRRQL